MPNTAQYIRSVDDLGSDKCTLEYKGFSGTAAMAVTTDIDFQVTSAFGVWLDSASVILYNHSIDDTIDFKVVDKDNVLGYGAGLVLGVFGVEVPVDSSIRQQTVFTCPYVTYIPSGLYIRIAYKSTGAVPVIVKGFVRIHRAKA